MTRRGPRAQGATLGNFVNSTSGAGWDFGRDLRSLGDVQTDVFYGYNGSVHQMFTRDTQTGHPVDMATRARSTRSTSPRRMAGRRPARSN